MEKINAMPIYWLGSSVGQLVLQVNTNPSAGPTIQTLIGARSNLEAFINNEQAPPMSAEAAKSLLANIDSILSSDNSEPLDRKPLSAERVSQLTYGVVHFQAILSTELPRANIFYTTPKRAYDMTQLINHGESILSQATLSIVDDKNRDLIIQDIREATRSLAFDIPTAVGFHIFRAVESIIKNEYFELLGITEESNNLGQHITLLMRAGVDEKILATLKNIKDYYRNPISHPEEFWDIDQAESALMLAVHAITVMLQDIGARHQSV